MTQANIIYHHLLFFFPINSDILTALIGGGCAFVFAYLLTFLIGAFCRKVGWLDRPAERRVHIKAVPRLGDVALFLAFFFASIIFLYPVPFFTHHYHHPLFSSLFILTV